MGIKIKDDTIISKLSLDIENIPNDDITMLAIHDNFARRMDKYVPMNEGVLSQSVQVTSEYVRYGGTPSVPYAHYQFEGVVYGPNIPIFDDDGVTIIGFWSPPHKHPTGAKINYHSDKHSRATHHWNEAMMNSEGDEFKADIKKIIIDKLKGESDG